MTDFYKEGIFVCFRHLLSHERARGEHLSWSVIAARPHLRLPLRAVPHFTLILASAPTLPACALSQTAAHVAGRQALCPAPRQELGRVVGVPSLTRQGTVPTLTLPAPISWARPRGHTGFLRGAVCGSSQLAAPISRGRRRCSWSAKRSCTSRCREVGVRNGETGCSTPGRPGLPRMTGRGGLQACCGAEAPRGRPALVTPGKAARTLRAGPLHMLSGNALTRCCPGPLLPVQRLL